mmetsp:Transcript_22555/g.36343  ORF Transcript_22555/g.36343 Transcript_22555/m.36343 type:complete len:137 (-) Transcript_22555:22-432(-)
MDAFSVAPQLKEEKCSLAMSKSRRDYLVNLQADILTAYYVKVVLTVSFSLDGLSYALKFYCILRVVFLWAWSDEETNHFAQVNEKEKNLSLIPLETDSSSSLLCLQSGCTRGVGASFSLWDRNETAWVVGDKIQVR